MPLLLCALSIAWWHPFCLAALLTIAFDTIMGIIALKTVITAEPRFNVRLFHVKLKPGSFQPDRFLTSKLEIDLGFRLVLFPILTSLVVTVNSISVPFAKKMRWAESSIPDEKQLDIRTILPGEPVCARSHINPGPSLTLNWLLSCQRRHTTPQAI